MRRLGGHVVAVRRAPMVSDEYGGRPRADWANAVDTPLEGASVQPAPTSEFTIDRDHFTTRFVAFLPDGADVEPTDRIVWQGNAYNIDGDVLHWDFGSLSHLVVNLTRSEDR